MADCLTHKTVFIVQTREKAADYKSKSSSSKWLSVFSVMGVFVRHKADSMPGEKKISECCFGLNQVSGREKHHVTSREVRLLRLDLQKGKKKFTLSDTNSLIESALCKAPK